MTTLCVLWVGCGDGAVDLPRGETRNVVQGGAQDGQPLRDILDNGGVPAVADLDMLGFFAEHAIDLPPAECNAPLCVHPMLGVAPRFNEGNWTMVFVAANTAMDPAASAQARHVTVMLEWSHFSARADAWPTVRSALQAGLGAEDRVSVYRSAWSTRPLVSKVAPSELPESVLPAFDRNMQLVGSSDPLRSLLRVLDDLRAEPLSGFEQRVLLFVDGPGDVRYFDADEQAVGQAFGEQHIPISVFRLGTAEFGELASSASQGNLYTVAADEDLHDAVNAEAATSFVPLAQDFELQVRAAPGYRVGAIHGAPRAEVIDGVARLHTPTLYVGARSGASDVEHGRRGGGGGWFVELIAESAVGEAPEQDADSALVTWSYTGPDGALREGNSTLSTPLGVGNNPPPDGPYFSDSERAKPFMMLNFFMAFRSAASLFEVGRCDDAQIVLPMMRASYDYWRDLYDDPDIDADMQLLEQLHDNIASRCMMPPVEDYVPDVFFACFVL